MTDFKQAGAHGARSLVVIAGLAAVLTLLLGIASARAAAAPSPAWSVDSVALPTHFAPGDVSGNARFELNAINIGGAGTDGSPITLVDQLPPGLEVESVSLFLLSTESSMKDFGPEVCETSTASGAASVRCPIPATLTGATDPLDLAPAEHITLIIHVRIPPSLSGPLSNQFSVEGGGAAAASVTSQNEATSAPAAPGLSYYRSEITDAAGAVQSSAGSHPFQFITSFALNTEPALPGSEAEFVPATGDAKEIDVSLPPGLIGNPTAVPRCTPTQFVSTRVRASPEGASTFPNECPDDTAVGYALIGQLEGKYAGYPVPVYNLVPPNGMPAQLGFRVIGVPFYIDTKVRTGSDYGITAYLPNVTQVRRVGATSVVLWGTPADPLHDPLRGSCLKQETIYRLSYGSCASDVAPRPFFRLPTSCLSPVRTEFAFSTWPNPSVFSRAADTDPVPSGCNLLSFGPTIETRPTTTVADSPTGLHVDLHVPQDEDPVGLGEADLRDATVALPAGLTVNPSSAAGLAGCSPAEVGLTSGQGASPLTFNEGPANCPDGAKIGSVEITTPLVDHPLDGSVFLAQPNANPFGSLLAIYIAVYDPVTGVVLKLAGKVTPDPGSGRLTATFVDNPQLPFDDFKLDFFSGDRAPLRTPAVCADYTTSTDLAPWSAPESGPDAAPTDSFTISGSPTGGSCPTSEAAEPHAPSFAAGTLNPLAGAFSPFVLRLARDDGSQNLSGLNLKLPTGLLAGLAGVPYCPESAIAHAAGNSGSSEAASPSCPAASRVGSVTVGAGAGPAPFYVGGTVYLAGPYRDAPLSLAIVTPALAGPFDLGTVVVRAALRVDPETAQVSASSDPIPTILQGIPLDVRSIAVHVDRPSFTRNPTSCEAKAVTGEAISARGQVAALTNRFQVGGCRDLAFAPRLALRVKGGRKRAKLQALSATVTYPRGMSANIARAQVTLPHSEFLEQGNIRTVCTRVQFAADACPAASIYGRARAFTPLLDKPLEGPVYLRSSSHKLPDLVAALNGQVDVDLVGRIDSGKTGGIRTTFEAVPDAPISSFRLQLVGGRKSLLVNSENICSKPQRAIAAFVGQNGRRLVRRPLVQNSCGHGRKKRRHGSR